MTGTSTLNVTTWPGHAWESTPPTVVADNVSFAIGRHTLVRDVSFTIDPGSLTALVGPNGAGKSTMLSVLAADRHPTTGGVSLGSKPLSSWHPLELAQVRSVMVQQHVVQFAYSVREIAAMGRAPQPADPDRDDAIIDAAMRLADVDHLADRDATTLSGGEVARMVFARTLAQDASIMLLDEPTAALDLRHTEHVMQVLRAWARAGCSVLVVVHDLNVAARYADRVLMFAGGELAVDDEPAAALTAAHIGEVYRQEVRVLVHPDSGAPLIVPTG